MFIYHIVRFKVHQALSKLLYSTEGQICQIYIMQFSLLSGLWSSEVDESDQRLTSTQDGHRAKRRRSEKSRLVCENCNRVYSYIQGLRRHKWKCEGTRIWPCSYCDKVFYRSDLLKLHEKSHPEHSFVSS